MRNKQRTKKVVPERNIQFKGEPLTRKHFCLICESFLNPKEESEICNICKEELYNNSENDC